jgi:hypothetical protein
MSCTLVNLPPLTDDESNVVAVYLMSTEPVTLLANQLDMPLGQFLDLLSGPAPQAHIRFARRAAEDRARLRFAEAAHVAAQTLERIAEEPDNDPVERRRAATTISRFLSASRRTVARILREAARDELRAPADPFDPLPAPTIAMNGASAQPASTSAPMHRPDTGVSAPAIDLVHPTKPAPKPSQQFPCHTMPRHDAPHAPASVHGALTDAPVTATIERQTRAP